MINEFRLNYKLNNLLTKHLLILILFTVMLLYIC